MMAELTFAYLRDVEVEPSDGEVGVLDLLRHWCLLFKAGRRATYFISFIGRETRETKWTHINVHFRLSALPCSCSCRMGPSAVGATRHLEPGAF